MKHLFYFLFTILFVGTFTSCVDNVIDEPPVKDPIVITTNATVSDVTSKWVSGKITEITDDLVFDAIIVADDESGNFYKSIVIQDETGGVTVRIEANNTYTTLPVGRKVYVKAKGLFIGDYNGLIQLGFGISGTDLLTIPFTFVDETAETAKIIPAERNQSITPAVFKINTLGNSALNTLIKLEDVQFTSAEIGQTYADAILQNSLNRTIEDCDGNTIVVRTSGFSDFAGVTVADQAGSLTCIYTIFGDTKQLVIRDLNDVAFTKERCGEVIVDLPTPNATISNIMALYQPGQAVAISQDLIFDAVVVADDQSGNFFKQLVLQDETGGINIQLNGFDLFTNYNIGREVAVKAQGLYIGDYNGLPQIGVLNAGAVGRIPEAAIKNYLFRGATSTIDYSKSVSIDEINASHINTLVQLDGVEFGDASLTQTYADAANQFSVSHNLQDCNANVVIVRTSGFSDFADVKVATGKGSLTAVVSTFSGTTQLVMRKVQDANMTALRCDGTTGGGGGTGTAVDEINENFDALASGVDVSINGWKNEAIKGTRLWRTKEFSGNTYIQATAFNDTEPEMETWIVTPQINMNGNNILSFKSAVAFYTHNGLSVHVSTNYNGDASAATWIPLTANLAGSVQANYDWVESGNIDLASFSGKVNIGFKYVGKGGTNTATYILDDIKVTK